MTIARPEWPWYVAEYVMAEIRGDAPVQYSVHLYLLRADGADAAYEEALALQSRLDEALRDDDGNVIEYRCIGMHDLDALQTDELRNHDQLAVVPLGFAVEPSIRTKTELSLFS